VTATTYTNAGVPRDDPTLACSMTTASRGRRARHAVSRAGGIVALLMLGWSTPVSRSTARRCSPSSVREVIARVMIGLRDDGLLAREGRPRPRARS
jgi:hypothetical protein